MAYTTADIENWLGQTTGTLDATILARIKAAVDDHAARHYDLDAPTDEIDQALIMQAARLWKRQHSPNGYSGVDELAGIRVLAFDPDVQRLLAGRLLTPGLFGPSANTAI